MKATTSLTISRTLVTTAALALSLLPVAKAQGPQGGGPRGGHRPPPSPLLVVLDADHDHQISADEIKGASAALLKLDANGDGKLSKDELRPKPPEGGPDGDKKGGNPPPPPADEDKGPADDKGGKGDKGDKGDKGGHRPHPPKDPLLEALDTDKDGELSADEIANAATSLATLDKDKDGVISEKEFRPEPPKGGPRDQ